MFLISNLQGQLCCTYVLYSTDVYKADNVLICNHVFQLSSGHSVTTDIYKKKL